MPVFLASNNDILEWLDRHGIIEHGARIGGILLAVLLADLLLHRLVPPAVRVALARGATGRAEEEARRRADTLSHVLTRSGRALLALLAFFTILPELGVNIGPLLASVGIVGIALGFGAQSLVRDFLSGLFILVEDQYRRGDVIRLADITGTVEEMTLRRTLVRDEDGVLHSIPNGSIAVVSNYTRDFARVNVQVRVAYGEDLSRVTEVIDAAGRELAADPHYRRLISEAPKAVRVDSVGDQGVVVMVGARTRPGARWEVAAELRRRLAEAFVAQGVRVPFPPHAVVDNQP